MKKHEIIYLILCILPVFVGCSSNYIVGRGPAQLAIGGTMYTPGVTIAIEEGGRFWYGPDYDTFYTDEAEEEPTAEVVEDLPLVEPEPDEPE
jgi:hypothetical protein